MVLYVSWAANAVLFVAACFLAADTANAVLTSLLAQPATVAAPASDEVSARLAPDWGQREIIVDRNLFASAISEQAGSLGEIEEDLEETKLPLTLLGTAAAEDPEFAWAAVQDRETRETLVVTIDDVLKGKAQVVRIERRRIVLSENGEPRELTFGDDDRPPPSVTRANRTARAAPNQDRTQRRARPARRAAPDVRRLAENRVAVNREAVERALDDPSDIMSQARFLPKFDGDQMVGLQVNAIQPDSVLREAGLNDGDLITELNGIAIDHPSQATRLVQEFRQSDVVTLVYEDAEGNVKSVEAEIQ